MLPMPTGMGYPPPDWHRKYCDEKARADRLDSAFAQADTARCKVEAELDREREIACRFQAENQQFERKIATLNEEIDRARDERDQALTILQSEREALDQLRKYITEANERHEKLRLAYHELEAKAVPEPHRAYQVHELQEEVSKLKHENNSLARRINEIRILTQRKA